MRNSATLLLRTLLGDTEYKGELYAEEQYERISRYLQQHSHQIAASTAAAAVRAHCEATRRDGIYPTHCQIALSTLAPLLPPSVTLLVPTHLNSGIPMYQIYNAATPVLSLRLVRAMLMDSDILAWVDPTSSHIHTCGPEAIRSHLRDMLQELALGAPELNTQIQCLTGEQMEPTTWHRRLGQKVIPLPTMGHNHPLARAAVADTKASCPAQTTCWRPGTLPNTPVRPSSHNLADPEYTSDNMGDGPARNLHQTTRPTMDLSSSQTTGLIPPSELGAIINVEMPQGWLGIQLEPFVAPLLALLATIPSNSLDPADTIGEWFLAHDLPSIRLNVCHLQDATHLTPSDGLCGGHVLEQVRLKTLKPSNLHRQKKTTQVVYDLTFSRWIMQLNDTSNWPDMADDTRVSMASTLQAWRTEFQGGPRVGPSDWFTWEMVSLLGRPNNIQLWRAGQQRRGTLGYQLIGPTHYFEIRLCLRSSPCSWMHPRSSM